MTAEGSAGPEVVGCGTLVTGCVGVGNVWGVGNMGACVALIIGCVDIIAEGEYCMGDWKYWVVPIGVGSIGGLEGGAG